MATEVKFARATDGNVPASAQSGTVCFVKGDAGGTYKENTLVLKTSEGDEVYGGAGSIDWSKIDTSEFAKMAELTEFNGDLPTSQEMEAFNEHLAATYVKIEDLTEVTGDIPTEQTIERFNEHMSATYVKMEELDEIAFDDLADRVAKLEAAARDAGWGV